MSSMILYAAIVLLLLCSAFFSASEMAFASVNPHRLKSKADAKKSLPLRLACRIADHYDDALGGILIGNNLANTAASSIATVIVLGLLGDGYAWVATAAMTLLVLIFGEIIPKVLAKQFPERFCSVSSLPIYILSVICRPITALFLLLVKATSRLWQHNTANPEAVSEDDFENMIDIAEDEGVLDEDQCDLLQNALNFDDVLAYEVLTPRVDMEALDIRDPYDKNIARILESTYSRLPVYEDTPDHIIGILHLNRVYKQLTLRQEKPIRLRELLLPVTYVHKTMALPDVLTKMREEKTHMMIVLDEYGGTMGLITMEDVLEQLVGEIWDETDEIEQEFVCLDDTHFEADGDMRIYDFFDEFDIDVDRDEDFEDDNTTVGGWVIDQLDGNFKVGDTVFYQNLIITVKQADEKRIERVSVERLTPSEEEKESDDE